MKYSIILPVYNGGPYFKECVKSILSQTLNDFNLQILDNKSTDGTLEWVQSLNDKRIKIYPSDKPLSIEENWSRILNVPKNEFITLIGHDDILDNNYLAIMDQLISKYPDASLYQCHFRFINDKGIMVKKCKPMTEIQSVSAFLTSLFTNALDTMGTGYMMRSSDYNALGGIKPYPNLLFADHELWIRLSSISYKATSKEECFSYRLHESISKKSDAVKYIKAFLKFMNFLKDFQKENDQIHLELKNYLGEYIMYYCRSLSHRLLKTDTKERMSLTVASFIEECKAYANIIIPDANFNPNNKFNIRLAKYIDSNIITRHLYLFFRKAYTKPIYS